ncbi:putative zinc-dependent alcohol [Phaeomoniella chlamydospora]|uniref:Putative zinc-dependent alcohol n=1 Tax=Phaeomoniella chlamydospora TaxID=158046 RepID=A0A0G2GKJ1_PHACM|nr:putative zinc-dependent alcohol [Phaeomoniella chlamydospora]
MAETTTIQSNALMLHGAKDMRFETQQVPPPLPHEVQVSIKATGLCGSDLHYYNHGRNGNFVLQSPLILGHESSGIVTAVPSTAINGSTSTTDPSTPTVPIGTRVALEVGLPCRTCHLCTTGRYNLCPSLKFRSSAKTFPHTHGTLTQTLNHPASMCHILPPSVTYAQGALVEPLAVSLHAINRSMRSLPSQSLSGTSALVLGAGAVGILTAAALSVQGVTSITIADIDKSRLEIASSLSPTIKLHTHLIPKTPRPTSSTSIEEKLSTATSLASSLQSSSPDPFIQTHGYTRVFECTGIESCVQTAIYAASPGGAVLLVGMGVPVQTLPLGAAALREVDIIGVFRYANAYPAAIALFASGKLDGVAEKVCTHRFALGEGKEAFEVAGKGVDKEGNVAVKCLIVGEEE